MVSWIKILKKFCWFLTYKLSFGNFWPCLRNHKQVFFPNMKRPGFILGYKYHIWNNWGHGNLRVGSPNTVYPSYCIISANKKDWEHLTQAMTTATRLWGYAKNSLLSTYSSPNVLSAYIICFVATESTQCNILHLKISIWLNGYT